MAVQTVCRDCIFAICDKNTQTGCSLNKIQPMVDAGCELVEAYDADGKEFYVIKNMICHWFRSKRWSKYRKTKTVQSMSKSIRKEMRIKYGIIVIASNDVSELKTTLTSIKKQTLKPSQISVVRHITTTVRSPEIMKIIAEYCPGIPWDIRNEYDDSITNGVIHDAIRNIIHPYYAIFKAGIKIPKSMFQQLDVAINDDLMRFGVILPDKNGNGMIGSTAIYSHYNGNVEENLRNNKCENLIRSVGELFPSFQQ